MLARAASQPQTTERSRKKREELLYKMPQKTYDEVCCRPIEEWVCWALPARA